RAAKNVGCDVPSATIDRAVEYVLRCRDAATPGFCYMPGGGMSVACTGTGILCLEICAREGPRRRDSLQAGAVLLQSGVVWNTAHFFYSIYYGAQATFQLGNNYWNVYRPQLHKTLFDRQEANGSWIG